MIRLYADGACDKGGTGGWAWVLVDERDEYVCHDWGRMRETTNNRMELEAVSRGLDFVPDNVELTIVSDSAYLINCMTDRWFDKWRSNGWVNSKKKQVENMDLWIFLLESVESRTAPAHWEHVKGHAGDRWNEKCDEWAVAARKGV